MEITPSDMARVLGNRGVEAIRKKYTKEEISAMRSKAGKIGGKKRPKKQPLDK